MKPLDFNADFDDACSAMMPVRECTLAEWVEAKNQIDAANQATDPYLLNELECIALECLRDDWV